ncbi:MAG: conjugal transfer protein TraD [Alphaproteobacteria bacterium]|nr:MAG: conjugal transfer protein TraD [Alphaproteobacteria bacterium]TAF14585.1 MAG: conjugal transfer protein TraD [Alphaproteobacteria bacterium]TAF74821.1 MAG: conjugal transfer protein TraD [Alphaproteobacteria bacterium]
MQERKTDTRQKILLGGLVVKAGLRDVDANIILGILTDGFSKIQGKDSEYALQYFKKLGDEAFQNML